MKKRIVVFLATLMCISLCACGGTESTGGNNSSENGNSEITQNKDNHTEENTNQNTEMSLVGIWANDKNMLIINEDGTGSLEAGGIECNITWKVNDEQLVVDTSFGEKYFDIKSVNGSVELSFNDGKQILTNISNSI